MPRNQALKRGLRLTFLIAGIVGCPLSDWQANALHVPELSPSENVALRFSDLSPSQIVALRFPETTAVGQTSGVNSTAALGSQTPPVHLIDFRVIPALPPFGHSLFCLRYPDDCKAPETGFHSESLALTPERWNELNIVNREVNRGILAEVRSDDGVSDAWVISPPAGDCKDYAVTKRHELLASGWPSRDLLLSEVVLASGQHHLVLVVRAKDADLVLDNLNDSIRVVTMTFDQYHWVRIQSPRNPMFWMRVLGRDDIHTAMLAN